MAIAEPITISEQKMWKKPVGRGFLLSTDSEINDKYRAGEQRIVTETNREKLPNFVQALNQTGYMEVRPFYQRRARWDDTRRSKLVESFIMNIPVPPLFLYERDFNKYEVMDGQQRISTLRSYYNGEFKLKGLEIWPELNGRTYSKLPSQVRSGLDRRSISYIIVLKESSSDEESATFLRQTVFERLNTGGVKLERQEIRNCLYQGSFNDLLLILSKNINFRSAFKLPTYELEEEGNPQLLKSTFYRKMEDVELILRFFALRHADHYAKGMHGFLDLFIGRANSFLEDDLSQLKSLFDDTIHLATEIYSDLVFRPYDPKIAEWKPRFSKAFYDAVMVGLSNHLNRSQQLLDLREQVIESTRLLFSDNPDGTFTGRGNTKADVIERIQKYDEMLDGLVG